MEELACYCIENLVDAKRLAMELADAIHEDDLKKAEWLAISVETRLPTDCFPELKDIKNELEKLSKALIKERLKGGESIPFNLRHELTKTLLLFLDKYKWLMRKYGVCNPSKRREIRF